MEEVNSNKEQKIIYLDSPLIVHKWPKEVFVEANVITAVSGDQPTRKVDFSKLRIEHLNKEEETELKKLFLEFPKIFHNKSVKLSFSNQIKHVMFQLQMRYQFMADRFNTHNPKKFKLRNKLTNC